MNAATMEGLTGASTSISLISTPMSVAKEAENKGDMDKLQRALGYAAGLAEQAEKYHEKTSQGMKLEAEEAKKQEKLQQEKLAESRKAEQEQRKKQTEAGKQEVIKTDFADISEEGKYLTGDTSMSGMIEQASSDSMKVTNDVTYNKSGETVEPMKETGGEINITL